MTSAWLVLLPVASLALAIYVIVSCPAPGWSRLLMPSTLMALMLVAIFALRPWAMTWWNEWEFYGLDVRPGFVTAMTVGTVAIAAFAAGVALAGFRGPERGADVPAVRAGLPPSLRGAPSLLAVVALTLIGLALWVAGITAVSGSPSTVLLFLGGRSAQLSSLISGLPTVVQVAPLFGSAAVTAYLVTRPSAERMLRREVVILVGAVVVSAWASSLLGTRRFLIPAVLCPLTALLLTRRLRFSWLFGAVLSVGFLATAVLPFVRSAGARSPGQSLGSALLDQVLSGGPAVIFRQFLTSFDTEMFSYISYVAPQLGTGVPYGKGRGTLGAFVQFPLPSGSSGGPLWSDQLLRWVFGVTCDQGVCPVASAPGVFLFDFGMVGVVVGMFVLGFAVRWIELGALLKPSRARYLVLAVVSGFSMILVRTDVVAATWWCIYFACLIAVAVFVLRITSTPPDPDPPDLELVAPQPVGAGV